MANSSHTTQPSGQIPRGFPRSLAERHFRVETCASTNSELIAKSSSGTELPEGYVLSSEAQTSGRGQRGNGWEAKSGQNLTASWLLRPGFLPLKDSFLLVQLAGVATLEVVNSLGVSSAHIKWPNDILVSNQASNEKGEERKLAGLLVETLSKGTHIGRAVVGVGLNVNQSVFETARAVSLGMFLERPVNLDVVLEILDQKLLQGYMQLVEEGPDALRAAYLAGLWGMDGPRTYRKKGGQTPPFEGVVEGVEEDGALILRTKRGAERFGFQQLEVVWAV